MFPQKSLSDLAEHYYKVGQYVQALRYLNRMGSYVSRADQTLELAERIMYTYFEAQQYQEAQVEALKINQLGTTKDVM